MSARNLRIGAVLELKDRLSGQLDRAGRSVRGFARDFASGARTVDSAHGKFTKFSNGIFNWFGDRTKNLVKNWFLSLKVSAAIGMAMLSAFFMKGVNDAAQFEQSLRNTTALIAGAADVKAAPGSPDSPEAASKRAQAYFDSYKTTILKLAPKLGKNPKELAEGVYDIVSGGFDKPKEAAKVLEAATKAASAGMADTSIVTNTLVQVLKAYDLGAEDAMGTADEMFQSVNFGIMTFEELAGSVGRVTGLAAMAGVSFKELMAAMIVMTRRGLDADEAATSLNQVLVSIVAPTEASKTALEDLFGGAGNVQKNFSAMTLQTEGLDGAMQNLKAVLHPTADLMKKLENANSDESVQAVLSQIAAAKGTNLETLTEIFPNIRALRGALLLAADGGDTMATAMDQMGTASGATDRAFKEQSKSVEMGKKKLSAYFDVLKIKVFSSLLPSLSKGLKGVGTWIQTEILDDPAFEKGTGWEKLQIIGQKVWGAISDWWSGHKDEVSVKIEQFFDWLGEAAIPKAVAAGTAIGKAVVPAIMKGVMASPEGSALALLLGGGMLSKGAGGLGAGGAAGGAGAAGTAGAAGGGLLPLRGAGAIQGLKVATLSVASLVLAGAAIKELADAWTAARTEVDRGEAAVEHAARTGHNLPKMQEEKDKLNNQGVGAKLGDFVTSVVLGKRTPNEVLGDEIAREKALRYRTNFRGGTDVGRSAQVVSETMQGSPDFNKWASRQWRDLTQKFVTDHGGTIDYAHRGQAAFSMSGIREQVESGKANADTKALWKTFIDTSEGKISDLANGVGRDLDGAKAKADPFFQGMLGYLDQLTAKSVTLQGLISETSFQVNDLLGRKIVAGKAGKGEVNVGSAVTTIDQLAAHNYMTADKASAGSHHPRMKKKKAANGGFGTVHGPTMFLAGEAGPEDFAFSPLHRGGLRGGGGGTHVSVNGPLVHVEKVGSQADVEMIADRLAAELEKRAVNAG